MKKIKVSEATGLQLDWMVERAKGTHWSLNGYFVYKSPTGTERFDKQPGASYSTEWSQGGPIIDQEGLSLDYDREWVYDPASADPDDEPDNGDRWRAEYNVSGHQCVSEYGPTALIAAMRCFVASKLGNEVEVPEGLL